MAPIPVWSGNLRLSLVLVPVSYFRRTSTEGAIAFRMIHRAEWQTIKLLKGIETERGIKEVAEEESIKGYEHAKGHYVLIKPEELDKLNSKRSTPSTWRNSWTGTKSTAAISRSPTTFLPDGETQTKATSFLRDALAKKDGRHRPTHHAWPRALGRHHSTRDELVLVDPPLRGRATKAGAVLRQDRDEELRCQRREARHDLIEQQSGKFKPKDIKRIRPRRPRARAGKNRATCPGSRDREQQNGKAPKVVNIMDALKKSMQAEGQTKVKDVVRKRLGKSAPQPETKPASPRSQSTSRRTAH